MSASDRRLIEESLPIKDISREAIREKNIRHGNISTLHVWWARRPTVACRAALLGSLLRDPRDIQERKKLRDFLVEFCKWEASDDANLVEKAHRLVLADHKGNPPKILDCFAGGGAIPLEALRLGCDTYAVELNPVASIIELCTLAYPQKYGKPIEVYAEQRNLHGEQKKEIPNRLAYDVERFGSYVIDEARKELAEFYPPDPDGSIPIGYLWARTVKCPNPECGSTLPLVRQLWLANKGEKKVAMKIIPKRQERRVEFRIVEGTRFDFDPKQGTMRMGSVECPLCRQSAKGTYLRVEASANRLGNQLMAVVLRKSNKNRKAFRAGTTKDLDVFEKAAACLQRRLREHAKKGDLSPIPDEAIARPPASISSGKLEPFYVHLQVVNYGIKTWDQLLNKRQALALVVLVEKTKEVYDLVLKETGDEDYAKAVATYLALVVNRSADYNTSLTRWDNTQQRNVGIFARQAIAMVWDYAELNPFERTVGAYRPMLEAVTAVITKLSGIGGVCKVTQGTATRLGFPDGTFDAIVTDPPYYDAVPYSDLSDFFYVLLKRMIGQFYPQLFTTPLAPKTPEIIQNSSLLRRAKWNDSEENGRIGIKGRSFFESEMTRALLEANRVLKPQGICTVVFAHKTITAWETLIGALLSAGFTITSSWPLHTEQKQRLRAHGSAALASSVWLVCRKRRPEAGAGSWRNVQAELDQRVKNRLDLFLREGIKGADALLSAIGPALEVFGRYDRVEKVTGDSVRVTEFLDKVREVVAHHALSTVLSQQELGNVDPPTAFYVLWKWTFEPTVQNGKLANSEKKTKGNANHVLIPYDDALKLARSVGADLEILLKTHLLMQEKEYVRLLGPNERKHVPDLGETARDGNPPATIDMIHRALNLWAAMEHAQLEEYLEKSGARSNETCWRVAQALSNLLPLQSKEKQMLDGLLARYAGGAEVARPSDKSLDEYMKKEER